MLDSELDSMYLDDSSLGPDPPAPMLVSKANDDIRFGSQPSCNNSGLVTPLWTTAFTRDSTRDLCDNELIPTSHSPPWTSTLAGTPLPSACSTGTFTTHLGALDPSTIAHESPPSVPRKRGRPKGSGKVPKPVDFPRPRRGRPPGTGHKQKQRLLGEDGAEQAAKRPRGRPRKQAHIPHAVSVEFGKMLVSSESSVRASTTPASRAWASIFDGANLLSTSPAPNLGHQESPNTLVALPQGESSSGQPSDIATANSTPSDCHRIITDEDPQRSVETLDDDEGGEGVGDGIGEEDDEPCSNDEVDDESESKIPKPASSPRRPLPEWLLEPFKARLEESKCRDENGLPPLYANAKTFWFPTKSTFFILQQRHFSPPDLFNPRFFLWDPEALCDRIPCPNCKRPLYRHGEISRPRRCVDVNTTFWIIGYRYRCSSCIHPKSKKRTVTFRSWDPRILEVLPPALSAEFPAKLSHRSGMSNTLFEWMRSCFQNGMGSRQFSDSLRVQHLLAHDGLHLQYLQHIALRISSLDNWTGEKYETFLSFDDMSPRGRHGFTPCSQFCSDLYDSHIEKNAHHFHQHTAMLTCEIGQLDHSHKITKHIARVDGEEVFTAVFSMTNEKGEIRTCNLTATKSHSQSEIALKRMEESLTLYGHSHPLVCYTDNMADKQFLERCIPSLRNDVVPIEKYGNLDAFKIPSSISILTKNNASSINDSMSLILDDVPQDDGVLVIGFDSEWNVEVSPHGNMQRRSKTAIIQIAYQNQIYILQISEMLEKEQLPHKLKLLLSHPRILKAGRLINADLTYLQDACHSSSPFVGGLDLAKFAKDRRIITNISKTSLSDLCALVLHKRLDKNVPERLSQDWENAVLTEEQQKYAAKDAYVSLRIYQELIKIHVPCPLPALLSPFIPVVLYSTDNTTVIAEGQLSPNLEDRTYDGINITSTRTLVVISKVLVPGAIVTTHQQRPLNSFGNPPFSIVCLRSHLRMIDPIISDLDNIETSLPSQLLFPASGFTINCLPNVPGNQSSSEDLRGQLIHEDNNAGFEEVTSLGSLLSTGDLSDTTSKTSMDFSPDVDLASAALGHETLGPDPESWDSVIHSRVLKDVWHVFHMFYISATHGLRKQFTREFRDAIFVPDSVDRARINAWGATQVPKCTYESLRNSSPEWLRKRCKHIIPPPDILYPLVAGVFRTYGPLIDPDSKKPLFSPDNWKTAKNVLELIKNGYLSDPPGVSLYAQIGTDKKASNLPIYRCARGTNATEGGVHTHIRSRLPKFGASIRHVQAALMDFVLRHNLLTGTYNSTGQHYRGHFSIWITNQIQELLISLQDLLIHPIQISGWINGNLYIPTSERIGILPIPEDIRTSSAMAPYVPALDQNWQRYRFLAEIQGTRKPVLPIHTATEKQLFRQLMNSNPAFSPTSGEPRWRDAVQVWNSQAERIDNVAYKLIEHLKAYYAKSKTLSNIKNALSLSAEARRPLSLLIHDPLRMAGAPVIPERQLQLHSIEKGYLPLPPAIFSSSATPLRAAAEPLRDFGSSESSAMASQSHVIAPSSRFSTEHNDAAYSYLPISHQTSTESESQAVAGPSHTNSSQIELLARQRVSDSIRKTKPSKVPRKRRTCRKCSKPGCPGSQKVSNCRNGCQDCGQKDACKGRNPKYLTKKCWEAWN